MADHPTPEEEVPGSETKLPFDTSIAATQCIFETE